MGKALRGSPEDRGGGRGALSFSRRARGLAARAGFAALVLVSAAAPLPAQEAPIRIDRGRFTVVCYPTEQQLALSLVDEAQRTDTFPGLPRPRQQVLVAIAPDRERFAAWVGPGAPEWGAAIAFPASRRIVLQGRGAGSDAGDPRETLRHELAHLALHEYLGDLPPRWFDEGYASYAAREWRRDDALAANLGLALRGMPTFDELEEEFNGGSTRADAAYALAYRAVSDLAALDPEHGLARLLASWKERGSLDRAIRDTYGITLADFELRWRRQTRRRYGALALFGDVTVAGLALIVLFAPLYLARRRRNRARLNALREADAAAERAERENAIDELLRSVERGDDPGSGRGETP